MLLRRSWLLLLVACGGPPVDAGDPPGDLDSDGDGILDVHESTDDSDNDGRPSYLDEDSDGDGIPDAIEAGDQDLETFPVDSDGDRVPDYLDTDSDDNGILDGIEGLRDDMVTPRDRDGDGVIDSADLDDDDDSVPDVLEMDGPEDRLSDTDRRPDRLDEDSDGDGLLDRHEAWCARASGLCDTDGDGQPDIRDRDSDGDGLDDRDESGAEGDSVADPPRDTDGDEIFDARDLDSDGDGVWDSEETDLGTDPVVWDTDEDGFSDGVERDLGTDPLNPDSRWDRRVVEVEPRHAASEEFAADLRVAKVDLLLSVGGSGGGYRYFSRLFVDAVDELAFEPGQIALGTAVAGTYGVNPWGCVEDTSTCGRSKERNALVTGPMRAAMVAVPITARAELYRRWAEGPSGVEFDEFSADRTGDDRTNRATLEFIQQVLTGHGYDVGCDGIYDELVDQPPVPSSPGDLFGGAAPGLRSDVAPPAGTRGAVGFREGSERVIVGGPTFEASVVRADWSVSSRWLGAPDNETSLTSVPESLCPAPAPLSVVGRTMVEERAKLIYFADVEPIVCDSSSCPSGPSDVQPAVVLRELAERSGSVWDGDDDGVLEPYTYIRRGEDPGEVSFLERLRDRLPPILEDIKDKVDADAVTIDVSGDDHGFVTAVEPSRFEGLSLGDTVAFRLDTLGTVPPTEGDQAFVVTVRAVTDRGTHLYEEDVLFLVPGTGRPR